MQCTSVHICPIKVKWFGGPSLLTSSVAGVVKCFGQHWLFSIFLSPLLGSLRMLTASWGDADEEFCLPPLSRSWEQLHLLLHVTLKEQFVESITEFSDFIKIANNFCFISLECYLTVTAYWNTAGYCLKSFSIIAETKTVTFSIFSLRTINVFLYKCLFLLSKIFQIILILDRFWDSMDKFQTVFQKYCLD